MKGFIGVAACALLASSAVANAETGFLDRSITLDGLTYRYQVCVPLQWNRAQQWPVILVESNH